MAVRIAFSNFKGGVGKTVLSVNLAAASFPGREKALRNPPGRTNQTAAVAASDQIKALIRSHFKGDGERFHTIALQIAASEARKGHRKLAEEIRSLVETETRPDRPRLNAVRGGAAELARPRGELAALLSARDPDERLADMTLPAELAERLERILAEQKLHARIRSYGLSPRRKLLLAGPPGTGKTMTAAALAGELQLPLFTVRLEGLLGRHLGETTARLRLIFDAIQEFRGVYFFDEFDSIGNRRADSNDVGEMRRVVNSFLQYLEADDSNSLILAATNHATLLDPALFRRFDDVLEYELPDAAAIRRILDNTLAAFPVDSGSRTQLHRLAQGLCHADIVRACAEAVKAMLIEGRDHVRRADIRKYLEERRSAHTE